MNNLPLLMLLERLLWPIPRVRWETSRSIAQLIREEHREAADGLLNWISARQLESEVVIGLGIIDAFDLGAYFEFADVSRAVRAPSLLSDWLLKKNFANTTGLSLFRYAVSPLESATLPQHKEDWFDRYCCLAVPKIFSTTLTKLQELTYFPFMMRWKHDWCWLQATNPRPKVESPHYFLDERSKFGQFDLNQRELYVSAYLRTLAFAAIRGILSNEEAEYHALTALTMNRGLADLEPVERPSWTRNLLPCGAEHTKELAQNLWARAETLVKSGEIPLALKVVDSDKKDFIELDFVMAIRSTDFAGTPSEVKMLDWLIAEECLDEMAGLVYEKTNSVPLSIEQTLALTQGVTPQNPGHLHTEIIGNIRLASPYVFNTSANIQCRPHEIRLVAGDAAFSRWIHWYADWAPARFTKINSIVGTMTTVLKSRLDKLRACHGIEIAQLVRVRRGTRDRIHLDHEVEIDSYWV